MPMPTLKVSKPHLFNVLKALWLMTAAGLAFADTGRRRLDIYLFWAGG